MTKNTQTIEAPTIEAQMLAEMKEQTTLLKQMDWKLWVLSNSVIDAMLEQGTLKVDPRKK